MMFKLGFDVVFVFADIWSVGADRDVDVVGLTDWLASLSVYWCRWATVSVVSVLGWGIILENLDDS